ncbi:dihydrodipicolinate synthase family protein [Asticcacaulis sp. YBE204]|uniref:dihydrodipicolinate synthase family protein n=1 Tax=Asticcacaulis sp. YBE204 TaxID=1282363 RepID=UPI0003C3D684|nr:dihydrodipicolinate synthase family protein [Asticcacaulis sp. YBE204]ESQ79009.1 hypothetical protein AEYBE204_11335 [Asticcacaulis sp. YBE204]
MTLPDGLCAFPLTPCSPDGQVDETGLHRLVTRLVEARVDSIGLLGSTGIYMYLSPQARRRALEVGLAAAGTVPVVAGVGALRTDEAVRHAQDAKAIGAAAGLLSAVSYTALSEDEVFEHVSTVARESRLPIVLYDNPGATHFHFTPALVHRLAQVPGIVAIKNPGFERAALEQHLAEQRGYIPEGFSIGYSGDWFCTEAMIAGADVWYSVLAGVFPDICRRIVTAARAGDAVEARRLDAELAPLWALFRRSGSLRAIYVMAEALDICRAEPPRPLLPLPDAQRQAVIETMQNIFPSGYLPD